jgi:phosphoglycerate dehydrogenase-like enzyme
VARGGDLSNVEAALVSRLTLDELRKMPRLRFTQAATAGLDHLPWEHIPPHVVTAGNAGSNADAVAEFALAPSSPLQEDCSIQREDEERRLPPRRCCQAGKSPC